MTDVSLQNSLDGVVYLLLIIASLLGGLVFGRSPREEPVAAAASFVVLVAAFAVLSHVQPSAA